MWKEYHTPQPSESKSGEIILSKLNHLHNFGSLKEDDYLPWFRENCKIGRFTTSCLSWNFKS